MNHLEIVIKALRNFCPDKNIKIEAETKIIEDIGLESIDFVDFIFELERSINKHIDIVALSVALSPGTKRFREVKVKDLADYIGKLN